MKQDFTDITIIMDRSGSMASCQQEAENGVNHFVEDQKKQPGTATFSLVQFDTEIQRVYDAAAIASVGTIKLEPRGMTALLDAVGKTINETGERLSKMNEEDRPGLVVVCIVTDGEENSSHEFKREQIKQMIEHQQTDFKWQFTFLGANQDAFAEAGAMGINAAGIANYNVAVSGKAYGAMSNNVSRMRWSASVGQPVNCSYTSDERTGMK